MFDLYLGISSLFRWRLIYSKIPLYRLIIIVLFGFLASHAQAQISYPQPKTKYDYLARSAGAYLGSIEYIRVLINSVECHNQLKSTNVPDYASVVNNELLMAFNESDRSDIKFLFYSLEDRFKGEAELQVAKVLAAVFREQPNRDVACGIAFALLRTTNGKAKENWLDTRKKYGK